MRVQPLGFEIRGTGGEQGNRGGNRGTGAGRNLARGKVLRL